jgi:hypothetical protein
LGKAGNVSVCKEDSAAEDDGDACSSLSSSDINVGDVSRRDLAADCTSSAAYEEDAPEAIDDDSAITRNG